MSDFHQEVTFKLYFTSTNSLCFWVQIVCLFVCLSVFWCLDYSRINEQIFINFFLWVGPGQKKKLLKERSGSYFGYKKIKNFQRSHFNVFLMNLAFYLIFLQKLIYMFYFVLCVMLCYVLCMYLYSAQYLHILQDSKRYLTNPTVQVQPQLTSN